MNFFVGLWPILSHYSLFAIAIAACLTFAFFVDIIAQWPPMKFIGLDKIEGHARNVALLVAAAIAISLFWYAKGVSDEGTRCKSQFTAAKVTAVKRGAAARTRAARDVISGVRDRRDTDNDK